jgi:hypothetical protein
VSVNSPNGSLVTPVEAIQRKGSELHIG